jgi:hypothetical protein
VQEFAPVAKDFQEHGWVRFTPHYLVWVCPASYHKSEECRSQCIRQGRYCTPDPDGDLAKGYSGADIVQVRLKPWIPMASKAGDANWSARPTPTATWPRGSRAPTLCKCAQNPQPSTSTPYLLLPLRDAVQHNCDFPWLQLHACSLNQFADDPHAVCMAAWWL